MIRAALVALLLAATPAGVKLRPASERVYQTPAQLYAAAQATCAAFPLRSTGTKHYFCECSTGAESGCVAGSDSNNGLTPATAKRTWPELIATFNSMAGGDTIALCRGGLWNIPGGGTGGLLGDGCDAASPGEGRSACRSGCGYAPHTQQMHNANCAVGASLKDPANPSTCDIRDYTASWGGTARPVLFAYTNQPTQIFAHGGYSTSGVRILNLELRGSGDGPGGGTMCMDDPTPPCHLRQWGVSMSACAPSTTHGWMFCNDEFNNLDLGINSGTWAAQTDWLIWGNRFTMNDLDAILGGPGSNGSIDANYFLNNGCWDPPYTAYAHVVYIGNVLNSHTPSTGVRITNNEMRWTGTPYMALCAGGPLVGHDYFDGLLVENNIIDVGSPSDGHAWGIGFGAGNSGDTGYTNLTIRGNWVLAGGTGIALGNVYGGLVENNVIIAATGGEYWGFGIDMPTEQARAGRDIANGNVTIRNNTIYLAQSTHGSRTGILQRQDGSGYVVANNAVYATSGMCWRTMMGHCSVTTSQLCVYDDPNFYDIGNRMGGCPGGESCVEDTNRWTFFGNNSCAGGAGYDNTPAAQSTVTAAPQFTSPPTDFRPAAGSPLLGAGSKANAPLTDFLKRVRPYQPSIGAYEK